MLNANAWEHTYLQTFFMSSLQSMEGSRGLEWQGLTLLLKLFNTKTYLQTKEHSMVSMDTSDQKQTTYMSEGQLSHLLLDTQGFLVT